MLDIKPIIKVTEEGKLVSDSKVRGRRASIRMLVQLSTGLLPMKI